jgi:ubiquitin-protein ligase
MASRLPKVLKHQLRAAIQEDHPHLIPLVDDADVRIWHFLVVNLPGVYAGGEYLFRLTAPDDFPFKPPQFEFVTPNGVYEPGGRICISIGEFHADSSSEHGSHGWRSALGMIGFAREVVNGMINPEYLGAGIRVISAPTKANRVALAQSSRSANETESAGLMAKVAEFEAAHPDHAAVRLRRMFTSADDLARAAAPSAGMWEAAAADVWEWFGAAVEAARARGLPDALRLQVFDALRERDLPARSLLLRALHVELLGAGPERGQAFDALVELMAGACSSAEAPKVTKALAQASGAGVHIARYSDKLRALISAPPERKKEAATALVGAIAALVPASGTA